MVERPLTAADLDDDLLLQLVRSTRARGSCRSTGAALNVLQDAGGIAALLRW